MRGEEKIVNCGKWNMTSKSHLIKTWSTSFAIQVMVYSETRVNNKEGKERMKNWMIG